MKILIIILVSIIALGGLASMFRIKEDHIPKTKVTYRLRVIDVVARLYISVPFFILMIITLYLFLSKIFTDSSYYAFGLLLPIILGFLSIPPLIVFFQYLKIEKGRIIEFDSELRQLIIKTKNKSYLINNVDIELVEYFNATPDKGPFDLEYLKLTLKDGSKLILTNLLTDILNYESLFKGIKRKRNKSKIFNKINCG